MLHKLDVKFYGEVRKAKDNSIVPDDEYMVFLAKDNAFLPTLRFYRAECAKLGADDEQLAAVDRTIRRVKEWREANPDRLKVPDVAAGEMLLG